MSQEKAAFERFESARTAARTHPDLKECLWGLVLTAAEISPEKLNDHLSEFAATYPDDIDVRLRLAVGHALAGEIASDLTGSWERFLTLLPAVRHSQDPLAASTFLAGAASVAVLGANYSAGRDISEQALRLCTDLRVDFAIGACHVYRAAAQIGQRLFAQASRSLRSYWQGSNWRDDPYFQVEALVQRARLLASQGALPEAIATREDLPDCESSARPLGSYLGTLSMILAADGQTAEARRTAELARVQGRGVESMFCSSLAEAISYGAEGRRECFASHAAALVIRCDAAQYLDGVVFAYRLWPDLLEVLSEDQRALRVVRMALAQSRDFDLAKRAGIACGHDTLDEPLTVLTPREQEVLGLLLEGMTNGQIASRLFITEATVKVHVRHILRKLGAKTRLQAVIRAQELAGPSDS
jgi:ATP/maltotriose-dependent transcriptional regulator MalT